MGTDREMQDHRLERDGDRPLAFRGEIIGEGESGSGGTSGYPCDWNRGVTVRIYRRPRAGYVVGWRSWSCWQGEGERTAARACRTPGEVLAALRAGPWEDGDGDLRPAEAEALSDAEDHDEGIAGIAVEDLDAAASE